MATPGKVQGIPEVNHALDQVSDGMADLARVNRDIAQSALPQARGSAPRRTGVGAATLAAEGTAKAALLTSPLVYMAVQEFGSPRHNIEGVHYAGDAMDAAEGHAREAYTAEVGRLAKKADLEWR